MRFYGKDRISVKGRGNHLFYGISFKITVVEMIIPGWGVRVYDPAGKDKLARLEVDFGSTEEIKNGE